MTTNRKPLTSEEYLDYSELLFFARDLKRQLEQNKPEDASDYAVNYLRMVQSCYHVVGTGFSYVLESNHNRKSLVFCLLDAFKEFSANHDTTCNDFFYLIEPLCPGFPKSLVFQACLTLPSIISCQILFDEWLKLVEEYFRNENSRHTISVNKAKSVIDEFQRNLPMSILQPRLSTLLAILDSQECELYTGELNYDDFKMLIFSHGLMGKEIQMVISYPLLV